MINTENLHRYLRELDKPPQSPTHAELMRSFKEYSDRNRDQGAGTPGNERHGSGEISESWFLKQATLREIQNEQP